ncbi:M12 family metallopeptidase [Chitinophaga terrae (ex Kim and Jung 2007)]|nr:M12 family metallopeptidase [Chitinophaga terrae (ex Kim and Jung 2007)]
MFVKIKLTLLVSMTAIAVSCHKDNAPETPDKIKPISAAENYEGYPVASGERLSITDKAGKQLMSFLKSGDKYILGGDIVYSESDFKALKEFYSNIVIISGSSSLPKFKHIDVPGAKLLKNRLPLPPALSNSNGRTGTAAPEAIWPNRTIYYSIAPGFTDVFRVNDAINHWKTVTNLQFVQRTNQTSYVYFRSDDAGAYSTSVGKTNGVTTINLGSGASTGNAIHEIGHAVGLYHEQCRNDRDSFITIYPNNILPDYLSQFDKVSASTIYGLTAGPFDFNSVMLYPSTAFVKPGAPFSMTRRDGSTFTAQRTGLSQGDIEIYNLMYNSTPVYARIEYENYSDYWIDWDRYWTQADVYVRFYANQACTIPAPVPAGIAVKVDFQYDNEDSGGYIYIIPPGTTSISQGRFYLLDYNNGLMKSESISLLDWVGCIVLPYYIKS